ncbi:hypothetical protein [Streptomyces sp. NPDC051162]|uniref:hypothetical protein n=1 Tax=Streptomyces sp. NPDC051162 TaxID=3154747 RepID=UPI0034292AAC
MGYGMPYGWTSDEFIGSVAGLAFYGILEGTGQLLGREAKILARDYGIKSKAAKGGEKVVDIASTIVGIFS